MHPIPLSALQHYLYCPRQCALIHLEQVWVENQFTAQGRAMHERAHSGQSEKRDGIRITRNLSVGSCKWNMAGQCDVVEFHPDGRIVPIEYKRGKPKSHRADEVQLCAQALCLEEMKSTTISHGYLFYGLKQRRTEVLFDEALRELTTHTLSSLVSMINERQTPLAEYEPNRCDACSLFEICQPKALRFKRGAALWFSSQLKTETS